MDKTVDNVGIYIIFIIAIFYVKIAIINIMLNLEVSLIIIGLTKKNNVLNAWV